MARKKTSKQKRNSKKRSARKQRKIEERKLEEQLIQWDDTMQVGGLKITLRTSALLFVAMFLISVVWMLLH